jgi:GntR family transcriptional regulator, transcriptional repressor for pyruvate dehydrogenase complex
VLYIVPMFNRVKPALRMPEAIARQIEEQICQGHLKGAQMLPSEGDLMKLFGVSRNTVREALRMLEASGLVRIKQGSKGGAIVTPISDTVASEFLVKTFLLGGVSPLDFFNFKLAMEPSMVELLALQETVDDDVLARIKANIAESKRLFEAGEPTGYSNMDFHVLLAEATGNMIFIVVAKSLRAAFDVVAPVEKEGHRLENIRMHEEILDAILKKDGATAKRLMKAHHTQAVEVIRLDTGRTKG